MKKKKTKTINVNYLARVEGEGSLHIKYDEQQVLDVKLKIFEPPRFFEALLRERDYMEAPDITSRICGICPIAYQMSSVHAMENALGMTLPTPIRELRRLCYCGEWIESHLLHIYMLHAPDFLGFENVVEMAKVYPKIVERGLKLKKAGNAIVALIGGREIHPINIRVGGFYRAPEVRELEAIKESIKWGREAALESLKWVSTLEYPDFEQDYEFAALSHPDEYPLNEGRFISSNGLDIAPNEYDQHFTEEHLAYTTALHSKLENHRSVLTGPLARFNLNRERLSPMVIQAAKEIGIFGPCKNPYKSIIIRSLEVLYAFDEALRILENYKKPDSSFLESRSRQSIGYAITEAPRGALYHRYSMDESGLITDAKIVPPTSVNQKIIENDLTKIASGLLHLPQNQLALICEKAIRNHDPCISCSTHFLKLQMERI